MLNFTPNELRINNPEELALVIKEARRGKRLMYFETTLSPALAASLLAINHPKNRPARQPHIDKQVRDLKNRRWQFNGESVKIDRSGYLIDGQKRCMACVEAGRSFKTMLVLNSDRLNINGSQTESTGARVRSDLPNRNLIAAVVKYEELEDSGLSVFKTDYQLSPAEVAAYTAEIDPDSRLVQIMRLVTRMGNDGMSVHAHYVWLATHFDRRGSRGVTDEFLTMLVTGDNIPSGSPVGILRRRLRRDKARMSNNAKKLLVKEKVYFLARTFAAWYVDEDFSGLMLPKNDVTTETILACLKGLR